MSNEPNEVVSNVEIFGEVLTVQHKQTELMKLLMAMRKENLLLSQAVEVLTKRVAGIDTRTECIKEMLITLDPGLADAYDPDGCSLPTPPMTINLIDAQEE